MNELKIKKEDEEKVINFGAFNYGYQKISNILNLDVDDVKKAMNDNSSQLNKLLQKGRDMADYVIDLKLFEMAKSGDLKALDKLKQRELNQKMRK